MLENFTVLSPHLDDAIWSLGGFLKNVETPNNIRVINIFSEHTFIYGKLEDPKVASRVRRLEDTRALNSAGITNIIYLDFSEALLRGYSFDEMFMDTDAELEDPATNELDKSLRRLISSSDTILIPACFGGHVDHYVTRNVALTLPGKQLFYEDLPYAARKERRGIAENFLTGRKEVSIPVTGEMLKDHAQLIQLYESQIAERHSIQINKYIEENGFHLWI
ncbi:MAG: PIG-L family deacetylase [bacterium]|nr:PIG-L family deacetylase [bacterium]